MITCIGRRGHLKIDVAFAISICKISHLNYIGVTKIGGLGHINMNIRTLTHCKIGYGARL